MYDQHHQPTQLFSEKDDIALYFFDNKKYATEYVYIEKNLGAYIGQIQSLISFSRIIPGVNQSDRLAWLRKHRDDALSLVDRLDEICLEVGVTPVSQSTLTNVADCIALMRRDNAAEIGTNPPSGI